MFGANIHETKQEPEEEGEETDGYGITCGFLICLYIMFAIMFCIGNTVAAEYGQGYSHDDWSKCLYTIIRIPGMLVHRDSYCFVVF